MVDNRPFPSYRRHFVCRQSGLWNLAFLFISHQPHVMMTWNFDQDVMVTKENDQHPLWCGHMTSVYFTDRVCKIHKPWYRGLGGPVNFLWWPIIGIDKRRPKVRSWMDHVTSVYFTDPVCKIQSLSYISWCSWHISFIYAIILGINETNSLKQFLCWSYKICVFYRPVCKMHNNLTESSVKYTDFILPVWKLFQTICYTST